MKPTRKWLLLRLLEDAGNHGATTADLLNAGIGSRYSARILELREDGYTIRSERERDGSYRYTLLFSPESESGHGEGPPSDGASHSSQSLTAGTGHSMVALRSGEVGRSVSEPSAVGPADSTALAGSANHADVPSSPTLFDLSTAEPHWKDQAA
jgi:hypothetical protein